MVKGHVFLWGMLVWRKYFRLHDIPCTYLYPGKMQHWFLLFEIFGLAEVADFCIKVKMGISHQICVSLGPNFAKIEW